MSLALSLVIGFFALVGILCTGGFLFTALHQASHKIRVGSWLLSPEETTIKGLEDKVGLLEAELTARTKEYEGLIEKVLSKIAE